MFSFTKKLDPNLKSYILSRSLNDFRVIIKYKKFQDGVLKKIHSYRGEVIHSINSCNIICASLKIRGITRLLEYPEIEYICFDDYLFLCGSSVCTANKVRFTTHPNIKGKGIGIGIIDTGIYPHTDLITPYNRISSFVDLINGLTHPYDDNGHGTCVAGIIAGSGEKSGGMYKGIAPESTLHCYKAFDKLGKGYFSDVLFSMQCLIASSEKLNVKVLCLPFESHIRNPFFEKQFDILVNLANSKNITCVIPSGSNKNVDGSIVGLAKSKNCITVAGYDSSSHIKPYKYSSAGSLKKDEKPNFTAACVNIVSLNCDCNYVSERNGVKLYPTKLNTSYKTFCGTSISAAFISAICALLYESNSELTPKDIYSLLKVSSETLDMPKNYQGEGKINIDCLFQD